MGHKWGHINGVRVKLKQQSSQLLRVITQFFHKATAEGDEHRFAHFEDDTRALPRYAQAQGLARHGLLCLFRVKARSGGMSPHFGMRYL